VKNWKGAPASSTADHSQKLKNVAFSKRSRFKRPSKASSILKVPSSYEGKRLSLYSRKTHLSLKKLLSVSII
jgi:hypothetical protein